MAKEIKQRITVESDQATRQLAELADRMDKLERALAGAGETSERTSRQTEKLEASERRLGNTSSSTARQQGQLSEETHRTGEAMDDVADSTENVDGTMGELGGRIEVMVTRFASAAAAATLLIQVINDIDNAARASVESVDRLGESVRGLSVNVGGVRAQQLLGEISQVAAENAFNVAGRDELLAAVSTLTDLQPNLDNAGIIESLGNLATVQRATGVGGSRTAEAFVGLQTTSDSAANRRRTPWLHCSQAAPMWGRSRILHSARAMSAGLICSR